MLHIEKLFEEQGIQDELDADYPLIPDRTNWKVTMLIDYGDVNARKRELPRLAITPTTRSIAKLTRNRCPRW